MADTVRYLLEEMVPELEDLERRGYFSRPEIRQIVAKRQEFEYALKRRASVQADYLRYIEYEGALERLRQLRRKERGAMGAPGLADHCIVRRTHFIYERMLRKFRGDLALWARWLRFCQRSASSRQMSKVLTRALQLHSTCAPLWTHAAAWEFEHNSNAAAARALMQRGLRMCKGADGLWHEYFRMEALYAARLAARREVLGIGGAGGDGEGEGSAGAAAPADAATAKVLRGAIARVVYASAVAAVPGSLPFRAKFLDVLRPLSLPGRAELEAHIYDDIEAAFGGSVEAVDLKARRALHAAAAAGPDAALQAALGVYEGALKGGATQALLASMLALVEEELQAAVGRGDAAAALGLARRCLGVVARAAEGGQLSQEMVIAAPRMHLRLGQLEAALQAAQALRPAAAAPLAAPALRQLLALQGAAGALGGAAQAPEQGLEAVRAEGCRRRADVWMGAIRGAVAGGGGSLPALAAELIEQQRGCARGPLKGGMGAAAACLVGALWDPAAPAAARALYRALLSLPLPGAALVHEVLDLELSLQAAGSAVALPAAAVAEVFEAGVGAYGAEDVDLWLRYARFEQGRAGGRGGGAVHWRAVKALRAADEFVARSHLQGLGHAAA